MKRNTPSDSHATLSYPPMAVKLSSMISDMNIPFSLENIQWREHVCEPWVLLENRDDLLNHILDLARYTIKGFEKTGRKEFKMYIHIEKKIILPQQEYETMAQGREDQERAEMIKATAMKELIGYQIATGRLLSRTELLPRLRTILREENAALEWSSLESLADQVSQTFMRTQKRGRSSLESSVEKAIEYLRVKGSDVESMGRCSICIQEVELKSYGAKADSSKLFLFYISRIMSPYSSVAERQSCKLKVRSSIRVGAPLPNMVTSSNYFSIT
ncbi:hypothetical protein GH714_005712 [Hevea brasiliensis]|uniref:Uncharacterized protein n=1 Tax=Hevea brasiliensis TaxID=3981 RepID=A0A6A6KDM1_HEVBR|nr:hypothetical protein GH714_005712 [Hevea brasiliensis]